MIKTKVLALAIASSLYVLHTGIKLVFVLKSHSKTKGYGRLSHPWF